MINKVILVGRVGADPQTKGSVTRISLATTEKYKDKIGQQVDKTEWHSIVFFGKLAEIVQQYVSKGTLLYIEGKIQTSKWQNNEGKDQYRTEIIASSIQMLGSKGSSESKMPISNENQNVKYDYLHLKNNYLQSNSDTSSIDDDLPF